MKKYVLLTWPDIQEYMENPDYPEECYFDPNKDCWFVPEEWTNESLQKIKEYEED